MVEKRGILNICEKCGLNIAESINGPLDLELRQHLWLIFKEMVTNAARHSGASKVDIILEYNDGILLMIVQDNGKGFNLENVRKGNGINNIERRAEKIGGDISVESDRDIGTRWKLEIKL